MKKTSLLLILALVVMTSAAYAGTTVTFWVTLSGSDRPIHQAVIGAAPGSTLTLSVWYSTDVPYTTSVTTLFGWDRAISKGTAAVPLDGKLTGTIATNINQDTTVWTGPRTNALMGGQYAVNPNEYRPYGLGTSFSAGAGSQLAPIAGYKLYDVTLTNVALTSGYKVKLWDAANRASLGGDCYLTGSQTLGGTPTTYTPGGGQTWEWELIPIIPEPTSMLALGSSLIGLFGLAIRGRRM